MRAWALPFLLLPIAVALGYGPALRNDLVWDDRIHILENPSVREARWGEIATQPVGSYYRPVVFATFALTVRLGLTGFGERLARGLSWSALTGFQAFRIPVELFLWQAPGPL